MSNKNTLIGKSVSLFLDGGWEIAGEVKSSDDDKFVVERDGDLFMVFKNKISCLLVTEKARVLKAVKAYSPTDKGPVDRPVDRSADRSAEKARPSVSDGLFPMNGISYEESAMSIPGGLLDDVPDNSDDDFSVIFKGENSSLEDEKLKNIEFTTEDDTKN